MNELPANKSPRSIDSRGLTLLHAIFFSIPEADAGRRRKEIMMRALSVLLPIWAVSAALLLTASPSQAQLGRFRDALKDKIGEAGKKVGQQVDRTGADSARAGEPRTAVPRAKGTKVGISTAKDTLYKKSDFVRGSKIIFYDNLSGEKIGEFPSRWTLDNGSFEVAKQGSENFIMCTDDGYIRPKIGTGAFPDQYTIEMEIFSMGPKHKGHQYYIQWMNAADEVIGEFALTNNGATKLTILGKEFAGKAPTSVLAAGKHTMRTMVSKSSIKCYIDNEQVADAPAVQGFSPVAFRIHMDPWTDEPGNPMLMREFRLASLSGAAAGK